MLEEDLYLCSLHHYFVGLWSVIPVVGYLIVGRYHRRRIELENKAKVVASDWGTEYLLR